MRCFLLLLPAFVQAQTIQLAPPQIHSDAVFFVKSTKATLDFDLENARIHYSFTTEPDIKSPVYRAPLVINSSKTLYAVASHPDFRNSPVATAPFVQVKFVPENVHCLKSADKAYPGKGNRSFCDLQKGSRDLHDGNWLGFLTDTLVLEVDFKNQVNCKQLLISTLSDKKAWIFPIKSATVYGETASGVWTTLGQWHSVNTNDLTQAADYNLFQAVKLTLLKTRRFRIELEAFGVLPAGHPGAGTLAWTFLDELVFQ